MTQLGSATLPYRSYNDYLKEKFGEKVYKVSLDAGFDCPNRDGTLAVGGCTYCDEGSRAPGINPNLSIRDQMINGMERMKNRYNAKKFIAYFQSFTNTYAHVDVLKERYFAAIDFSDVVGLSVSTRPDTVSSGTLDLLDEMGAQKDVWLELGLQTMHDKTNEILNRWHTYAQFEKTLLRAKTKKNMKVCVHLILGLPGETLDQMHQTIDCVAKLPIDGLKLHTFHVLLNTALAKEYEKGLIQVFDEAPYIQLMCDILEKIPPHVVIQRVTGDAHPQKLIAPRWVLEKARILRCIQAEFQKRKTTQGKYFISS